MHDEQTAWRHMDLFAPTEEHRLLADTLRTFVTDEVEPQAAEFNRDERGVLVCEPKPDGE